MKDYLVSELLGLWAAVWIAREWLIGLIGFAFLIVDRESNEK